MFSKHNSKMIKAIRVALVALIGSTLAVSTVIPAQAAFPFGSDSVGMTFPVAGQAPMSASGIQDLLQPGAPTFTGTSITWKVGASTVTPTTFVPNTVYSATVVLTLDPSQANTCPSTITVRDIADNAKVNAAAAVTSAGTSPTITCSFTTTFPSTDLFVPSVLPLVQPAYNQTPSFPIRSAYNITVHWYNVAGGAEITTEKFAIGAYYRATVDIGPASGTPAMPFLGDPGSGYTCLGLSASHFTAPGATTVVTSYSDYTHCHAEITYPMTPYRVISHSNIKLALPIPGTTVTSAASDADGTSVETTQYLASATWRESATGSSGFSQFVDDTAYSATINIAPVTSLGFAPNCSNVPANFFTVNGYIATNAAASCQITIAFDKLVSLKAMPIVAAPVVGQTAASTIAETSQYIGTIGWTSTLNSGKFLPDTEYAAYISLRPKAGYTCNFAPANYYKIAGAIETTNSASSCNLVAKFARTPKPVTISEIAGIQPPSYASVAARTITDNAEYSATVSWNPSATGGIFLTPQAYTATITIQPKSGFTCFGTSELFFKVAGASSVKHLVDSCTIEASFPSFTIDSKLATVVAASTLLPGESSVTGADTTGKLSSNLNTNEVAITGTDWGATFKFKSASGKSLPVTNLKSVILYPGSQILVTGFGYKANSHVYLSSASNDSIIGSALTNDKGEFAQTFDIPVELVAGKQVLQLNGYDDKAEVRSVSYAVTLVAQITNQVQFAAKAVRLDLASRTKLALAIEGVKSGATLKATVGSYSNSSLATKRVSAIVAYLKTLGVRATKIKKLSKSTSKSTINRVFLKLNWVR